MHSTTESRLAVRSMLRFGLAVIILLCFRTAVAQATYIVTDLGTFGGNNSIPQGINNRGQVVGFAETTDTDPTCDCPVIHAFLWHQGVLQDLGTLGGRNSGANSINREGQAVGFTETSTVDPNNPPFLESRSFRWEEGLMTDLGTLGGNDSFPTSIAGEGRVVGGAQTGQPDPFFGQQIHPFLWKRGLMIDLGTLGGSDGFAAGINEVGQVAGGTSVDDIVVPPFTGPPFFAFLWQDGVMTNLGAMGGIESVALGINNRSQVAGEFTFPDADGNVTSHAFLWEGGVMKDLGTVRGDQASIADAIDDLGRVVGGSGSGFIDGFTASHAFLWRKGLLTDLNTRIPAHSDWQLLEALGINARGQIVAYAIQQGTGNVHAVLLNPLRSSVAGAFDATAAATSPSADVAPLLSESARRLLALAKRMRFAR